MSFLGGCQCGAVRYEVSVPPQASHVCHCRMCQRATGGVFAALAGAPKDALRWTGAPPTFFASSNLATRAFCARCGTPLTFAYTMPSARIYVTIGSMDEPSIAPIERQFGIESKLPWVRFCEDIPAERTGESLPPELAGLYDGMVTRQSGGEALKMSLLSPDASPPDRNGR